MTVGSDLTNHYLLDGQSVIAELQDADDDGRFTDEQTGLPQDGEMELYCPGPRGVEFHVNSSGLRTWYLYDGLGSVLAEMTNEGTIYNTRKYDVYGGIRAGAAGRSQRFCGSLGHTQGTATGPAGYGLIYMRARWYDPAVGRFVSEDPAGDGANWYTYASNNAVRYVDPDGRFLLDVLSSLGIELELRSANFWYGGMVAVGLRAFKDLLKGKFSGVGSYIVAFAVGGLGMGGVGASVHRTIVAELGGAGTASWGMHAAAAYATAHILAVGIALGMALGEIVDVSTGQGVEF